MDKKKVTISVEVDCDTELAKVKNAREEIRKHFNEIEDIIRDTKLDMYSFGIFKVTEELDESKTESD